MREIPAHPAQASAYLVQSQAGSPATQCVQLSLSLGETCAPDQLRAAWEKVAAVHGMLRSGFRKTSSGEFVRREEESAAPAWQDIDWRELPPTEIPTRWTALLEEDASRPIDLAAPPLLRFATILLPGGHCHLLATFPKLLLDEDSLFHLICEWLEALEGVPPTAPAEQPEPPQAASPATADWWKHFFSGAPEPLQLRVGPPLETASAARCKEVLLDRETTQSLHKLCQRLGVSTGDALFAAWGLVLGRLTAQRRVVLLAPCRLSETLDCGYFDNLLPAHLTLNGGQSIEAFLKATARESTERAQQAFIPLERVLGLSEPASDLSAFGATFQWLPPVLNDRIHDTYPRWINSDAQLHRRSGFPLHLETRDGNRIGLRLEFEPTIFPQDEIEKLLSRLTGVLDDFLAAPNRRLSELRILNASEWDFLKAAEKAVPTGTAPTLEEQLTTALTTHADRTVAEGPGESILTYSELDSHASSLAAWLRSENIADGWNIAICLNATAWLPVAIVGTIRAGDTCVPLDATASPAWLMQKLDGFDVELILCDSDTARHFAGTSRRLLVIDQQWESVAAVPTTSAASAKPPKAYFVLPGTESSAPPPLNALNPKATATAVAEAVELLQLGPDSRLALTAPSGTGAYFETLLAAITSGATLQLADGTIPETCTHLRLAHGQWRNWVTSLRRLEAVLPEALEVVCVDAAAVPATVLDAWQTLNDGQARWIFSSSPAGLCGRSVRYLSSDRRGALTELSHLPLGAPGPGTRACLQDSEGQPLPAFYPGTIEIATDGYPDKTLSVEGWRDAGGELHALPTRLSAIENALCEAPEILDAHVAQLASDQAPAAWVITTDGTTDLPATLRAQLAARSPERLEFLLAVESFPLSAAGEIDTVTLPRPQQAPTAAASPARPTPTREWTPVAALNESEDAPSLFLIHDIDGDPAGYQSLAGVLAADWSVHVTSARGLSQPSACHTSLEAEAASLVEAICLLDPEGPYHLVGYGFGGLLAFEMARQLRVARRPVPYLAIAGAFPPEMEEVKSGWLQSLGRAFRKGPKKAEIPPDATPVERAHHQALSNYLPHPLEGAGGIILAADQDDETEEAWLRCIPDAFVERMSCNWREMLTEPSVKRLAVILRDCFVAEEEDD